MARSSSIDGDKALVEELARQAMEFFPGSDWDALIPALRRVWEMQRTAQSWAQAEDKLYQAWIQAQASSPGQPMEARSTASAS